MLTYKKAGVDTKAAGELVKDLKKKAPAIGSFAGLFPLEGGGRHGDCLVASTDGVGTKLKVAFALDRHETVGIDLVAMCVNDLITCGARPLFFLDYMAVGKLRPARFKRVLSGILEGCRMSGIPLIGGETAEMPGFYPPGEYDLAGFAVGIVPKRDLIDGSKIFPGDILLGMPSSGLHSNGFSLVRKIFPGRALRRRGPKLLTPTRIYVPEVRALLAGMKKANEIVLGMAHITGGGIPEKLPRIIPKRCRAVVETGSWKVPKIFEEIRSAGRVPEAEMFKTFNMGIGMIFVVRPNALELARSIHPELKLIGRVESGRPGVVFK